LIFEEVTDKNKLALFYGPQCILGLTAGDSRRCHP